MSFRVDAQICWGTFQICSRHDQVEICGPVDSLFPPSQVTAYLGHPISLFPE